MIMLLKVGTAMGAMYIKYKIQCIFHIHIHRHVFICIQYILNMPKYIIE
jgi:hypothetical protein